MPALSPACVFPALHVGNERDTIDENHPVGMVCNNGRRPASGYSALLQRRLAQYTATSTRDWAGCGQFWLRYFLPGRMSHKQASFMKRIQLQTPEIVEQLCLATTKSDFVMPNQKIVPIWHLGWLFPAFNQINLNHANEQAEHPQGVMVKAPENSKYHVVL